MRPRCGMPMVSCSTPNAAAPVMSVSNIGMSDAPPSSENRFCPV